MKIAIMQPYFLPYIGYFQLRFDRSYGLSILSCSTTSNERKSDERFQESCTYEMGL